MGKQKRHLRTSKKGKRFWAGKGVTSTKRKVRGMTKTQEEMLKSMDGNEIWTNIFYPKFDGRICVLVKKQTYIHGGKRYHLPVDKIKPLFDDAFVQEFGYRPGTKAFLKSLDQEFGV